jgi:hypothetical protein
MTPVAGFAARFRPYQRREIVPHGGNMNSTKHMATVALMLNLGAAGIYAQQRPVAMTFSGTSESSSFNLASGAGSSEDNFAGAGTLGSFTFRDLAAELPSSSPPSTCSGPHNLYAVRAVTTGVFRFQDGSLLIVTLKQGSDCIDLAAQQAHCTVIFQITGGTGRFKNASGMLTFTETIVPVLADASQNPVFFASTGTFTGMVSGAIAELDRPDERQ